MKGSPKLARCLLLDASLLVVGNQYHSRSHQGKTVTEAATLHRTTANSPAAQPPPLKLNSSLASCSNPALHETRTKVVQIDGMQSGLI